MDYIVLDIEFNGRKFASELPMEVIEIGAVRLNSSLQQTGEFSALIKPVYFAKLNSFIKKKTGIPQADIDKASRFPKVIREFMSWLQESENPLLITWGGEDMKRIVLDTRMHKIDDAYWLSIYSFDLLKGYLKCKELTNDVSVEAALQELGIPTIGTAHRALDDARMTAEIFKSVFEELDFEQRKQYKDVFSNAKERRIVKNAIRSMHGQRTTPTWELFVTQFGKDKPMLQDPRKVAELKVYFEEEAAKPPKPITRKPKPQADAGEAEAQGDATEHGDANAQDEATEHGDVNAQGEATERGDTSEPSSAGERGDATEPGSVGERGDAAEPGSVGERGDAAEPGSVGERGDAAEPGSVGERGDAAEPGSVGERGDAAEPGSVGERGDAAEPGSVGERGDAAEPGSVGERGDAAE